MSLDRARQLVNSFNDGDFDDDIEPYFNDLITFFKFVKKYGLLDELDLGQVGYREWDDDIIEYLDENHAREQCVERDRGIDAANHRCAFGRHGGQVKADRGECQYDHQKRNRQHADARICVHNRHCA